MSSRILGANMANWYDVTRPGLSNAFKTAGMTVTRWPGGSEADIFHWQTNGLGAGACGNGYLNPASSFDHFMTDVAQPAHLDVAITVNYGSNPACTGGASPAEAAGWVAYANTVRKYGITWWSVGNEQFGSWETDNHSSPHDPSQYAALVATQFYPQMHAASKIPIHVCVDVQPNGYTAWDNVVLAKAKYDCVELHYYAQAPFKESDAYLVDDAAKAFASAIKALQAELKAAGHSTTPIYVGEIGSVYATPGKQAMSITQALYAGQALGELLDAGVERATWWLGFGGCETDGNFSNSIYGWQNFGGYMIFSDGHLKSECGTYPPPLGTLLPTARAYQVASYFVRDGEHMLATTATALTGVRAYATTYGSGYALMLFNTNETATVNVPVKIAGKTSGNGGTIVTYDKAIYDESKANTWGGPTLSKLAAWSGTFTVNLPPWSMVVVQVE